MHCSFNNKTYVHAGPFEGSVQLNIYIFTLEKLIPRKRSLLVKRKPKSFIFILLGYSREGFLIREAEA